MNRTPFPNTLRSISLCALFVLLLALTACGGSSSGGSGGSNGIAGPDDTEDSDDGADDSNGGTPVDGLEVDVSFDGTTIELEWDEREGVEYNVIVTADANCDIANYAECTVSQKFPEVSSPFALDDSVGIVRFYVFFEAIDEEGNTQVAELGAFRLTVQFPFNETGIDWCADRTTNYDGGDAVQRRQNCEAVAGDWPGQDGMRLNSRDVLAREGDLGKVGAGAAGFDFTKLDAEGNELPFDASEWVCVSDNHTGLTWEVKTVDGLRDQDHNYTWYDSAYEDVDGRTAGVMDGGNCEGSRCDTEGYVAAVNDEGLCGASDWRMPTIDELHSILHMGRTNPAIDEDFFPNTVGGRFWSSSLDPGQDFRAWYVRAERGRDAGMDKNRGAAVRLVRVTD